MGGGEGEVVVVVVAMVFGRRVSAAVDFFLFSIQDQRDIRVLLFDVS